MAEHSTADTPERWAIDGHDVVEAVAYDRAIAERDHYRQGLEDIAGLRDVRESAPLRLEWAIQHAEAVLARAPAPERTNDERRP